MPYENFVGLRYLMSKKRSSRVVSIITLISISGVALGVTALIVVLSVMGGFKKDLMQKILGTKAHIVVQGKDGKMLEDVDKVIKTIDSLPGVTGASPFSEHEVMISSPAGLSGVMLRGIDIKRVGQVSKLPKYIIKGKLAYLNDHTKLMDNLEKERDKELDALLAKIRKERQAFEKDKAKAKPKSSEEKHSKDKNNVGDLFDNNGNIALPDQKLPDPIIAPPSTPKPQQAPDLVLPEADEIPDLPGDDDGQVPDIVGDGDGIPSMVGPGDNKPPKLPGLIIGPELAKSLQVTLGDEVNVVTPNGELGPTGRLPKSRPFRIVGIFYSGMYEYDANFAYTRLSDAQDFISFTGAKGIELKTVDVEQAVEIAGTIQSKLGDKYDVLDWMEMNRSLFYALKLEKIAMFVVLTFIILVASFSIIAMLIMIVIEKGREIAVLKSLGASDQGIMWIFIFQGTVIGTLGAIIGLGLGLLICYLLKTVGFPLNSEVYYISKLPVDLNPTEVVLIVVCAVAISMLATIYPSIQAARLKPVDGLRDD